MPTTEESVDTTQHGGMYRFVLCEGCLASLPVGESWDTKIQCRWCRNVQQVEPESDG